jgi:hypothetical protein
MLAGAFVTARTVTGARLHVCAVLEHAPRRVRVLGVTADPTGAGPSSRRATFEGQGQLREQLGRRPSSRSGDHSIAGARLAGDDMQVVDHRAATQVEQVLAHAPVTDATALPVADVGQGMFDPDTLA